MSNHIPTDIVRKFIFDVLMERSNKEMEACEELIQEDMKTSGVISKYSSSIGWQSSGTRVIADEIMIGQISVKEAIQEILAPDEIDIVKNRCIEYIHNQKEIDMEL